LLTFEATPGYLSHPLAAERAAALLPRAKLIVLLRDPAERAISQYVHERRRNHESLELEEALAAEPERLAQDLAKLQADPLHPATEWERHSYLARGRYAEQLERWLGSFDRSQLLIVRSEDLYEDSANVYRTVLSFLQLREWAPPRFDNFSYVLRPQARRAVPVSDEARAWLRDYFRPHNDRLREMLGRDFEWS
jgi:hypothetical protein